MYFDEANKYFDLVKDKEDKIILAVESSCDETACAILKEKK